MREQILDYLRQNKQVTTGELVKFSWKDRTTVYRWLKRLVDEWKVEQIKKWLYKFRESIEEYFDIPIWERKTVNYNPSFLKDYIPNETNFFTKDDINKLENSIKILSIDTDYYKNNKRLFETLLIDLSYASSYLEWNTYSYLDTEVLVKYNEMNKQKTSEETQMVLNHKKAIEYMIYYKKDLKHNKQTFSEIHSLLWEKLLLKEQLWTIRNNSVEIGWSTYEPLDNQLQLNAEFDIFLKKLNQIKNPFEQSLFIMTFIPYFQLFIDVNKRTSRIIGNLPLIKNNLPVLSLIQLEKKKYIMSVLAVYELNDISLLKSLWIENYLLNLEKYKTYF